MPLISTRTGHRTTEDQTFPATHMQEAMVLRTLSAPEQGDYVQQLIWRWKGPFCLDTFRRSWAILATRHEVLRSHFKLGPDGHFTMVTTAMVEIPILFRRVVARETKCLDTFLSEERSEDRKTGLDTAATPMMRLKVYALPNRETEILWTSHHALFDGRGRLILLKEFRKIYFGLVSGRKTDLEPAPHYGEFLDWYARKDSKASVAFWKSQGRSVEPTPSSSIALPPRDQPSGPQRAFSVLLPGKISRRLKVWAQNQGLSMNILVMGAWALTLARTTGQKSVCFGAPRAGRHPPVDRAESMVGVFVNTVPMAIKVDDDVSKQQWLQDLRSLWWKMRAHEQTSLRSIARAWDWPDNTHLFETIVGYERYQLSEIMGAPQRGTCWAFQLAGTTEVPLTTQVYDGRQIRIELTWDPSRFTEATIHRLSDRMRQALEGLATDAGNRLGSVDVLSRNERATISKWSRRRVPYPADKTLHQLFSRQVAQRPGAPALKSGSCSLTYGEVEARANRLAHQLIDSGVRVNDRIGLLAERSVDQIVAIVGILKSGAAYLPLDPEYPDDRLRLLLAKSQTRMLLHDQAHSGRLSGDGFERILIGAAASTSFPDHPPKVEAGPHDLAYVMFTSGSTGEPKGVEVPHRAVVRLLFGVDYVRLGPENRLLHLAPGAFDAATFELWGSLLHGGLCVVYPDRVPTLQKLEAVIREERIDTLWLTCSLFNFIVDEAPEILKPIRQLLTGGEALSPKHVAKAQSLLPDTQLINGYGPTETTTFACCHPIPAGYDPASGSVPIGRPIGNTNCHVLDRNRRIVPLGSVGELHIGGPGVARGYLNRPDLTAERFVQSPFDPGDRLYRTGDLVRWRDDGRLEYIGRIDDQVKIQGHRIEPGEIETALCGHPEVRQAVVLVETHPGRGKELAAYVAGAAAGVPKPENLKAFLGGFLPDYLIPARVRVLAELPRNANGKTDRKALESLPVEYEVEDKTGSSEKTPANPEERLVCDLFSEILCLEKVGVGQSFFCLGGNSLKAAQLIHRLSRTAAVDVGLKDLYDTPHPRGLARLIRKRKNGPETTQATRLVRIRKREDVPVTGNQSWYYKLLKESKGKKAGNISRAFRIHGPLNIAALRKAVNLFVSRHEGMRTVIRTQPDGSVTQSVLPEFKVRIRYLDFSAFSARKRLTRAKDQFRTDGKSAFNLAGPLGLKVRVIRLGQEDHVVSFIFAHANFDAVSLALFYREFSRSYAALSRGEAPELPAQRIHLIDYAAWHKKQQKLDDEARMAFWRRTLRHAPSKPWFPTDGPATEKDDETDRTFHFLLAPDLSEAVRRLSSASGSTVFMTILAANAVLIERHTAQNDFLIVSVVDLRRHASARDVVGFFGGMIFFRVQPRSERTFSEFLRTSIPGWVEAVDNRTDAIWKAVKEVLKKQNRESSKLTPFFLTNGADDPCALELSHCRADPIPRHFGAGDSLPGIELRDTAAGISILLTYRTSIFKKASIKRYAERFEGVIRRLVGNPDLPIAALPDFAGPAIRQTSTRSRGQSATAMGRRGTRRKFTGVTAGIAAG